MLNKTASQDQVQKQRLENISKVKVHIQKFGKMKVCKMSFCNIRAHMEPKFMKCAWKSPMPWHSPDQEMAHINAMSFV
jgi:hypothetical protein